MARKILYSPAFGAGWVSWADGPLEFKRFMLTYQPLIDALEQDVDINPALEQFQRDAKEKYGIDYVCVLGADDLRVAEVNGRVRINEYDGSESYEEEGEYSEWL